jgi:hypothetical protein
MRLLGTVRCRPFALLAMLGAMTALFVGGATCITVRAEADPLFDYPLRTTALPLGVRAGSAGLNTHVPEISGLAAV